MKYEEIISKIKEEFPDFELCANEDSKFISLLSFLFKIITLGKINNFASQYTLTLRDKIYTPKRWSTLPDKHKASILRHELIHMKQQKKYTLPVFLFCYFLLPFPFFFSWFRARIEWEAYEESMRFEYEINGTKSLLNKEYRNNLVDLFVGPYYGWMWPYRKQVEKWYDDALKKIISH